MALPGGRNPSPAVHHLDFPRPTDHGRHCQQERKQTEGNDYCGVTKTTYVRVDHVICRD